MSQKLALSWSGLWFVPEANKNVSFDHMVSKYLRVSGEKTVSFPVHKSFVSFHSVLNTLLNLEEYTTDHVLEMLSP
jgi:hypothetical protein